MSRRAPGSGNDRIDLGAFYDAHPYPPPVRDLEAERERWAGGDRPRAQFHLLWPLEEYRDDLDVLVTGCGTSQAARYALRYPHARVVGIDVSEASLAQTETLRARYELTNLELRLLAVEQVDELDREFDLVVCTGVLHHLADPPAGLAALGGILRVEGALQLMVYGSYGRLGVSMLQEYARRLGLTATDDEIRLLAETLTALPPEHPLVPLLVASPDFRQPAGLADALLHPRERSYTVPEVYELLDTAGLAFGRWYRQAPYAARCGAIGEIPHAERLASLPEREQHTAVELLRGTIARHSLIAYAGGSRHASFRVDFDAHGWQTLIPIRVPDAVCTDPREGSPADAAAVLINPAHAYSDLILPVDERRLRVVRAIDGRRTIAELIALAAGERDDELLDKQLFEDLWLYDQVVFRAP